MPCAGGWFHSGDRARLDVGGHLHLIDRIKDSTRRRVENISAQEIEAILARSDLVLEVAVVPVPSDLGEDDIAAFVVPAPGAHPDPVEIVRFADRHMAHFMVARYVHFQDELPKTPNTRIEKYRLREWGSAHLAEMWDREQYGVRLSR